MSNEINFKELWDRKPGISIPDTEELLKKAGKQRNKTLSKLVIGVVLITATLLYFIYMLLFASFVLLTTKVGILLVISALLLFLAASKGNISLLINLKIIDLSSKEYLTRLKRLRTKLFFLQTKILSLYFLLLFIGIILTMIETTARFSTGITIICFVLTGLWFAFNWFYLRPKTIRKEQSQLNALILEIDKIQLQFAE